MSQPKRYYWLKLKDDFFDSLGIKKLRRKEKGDTYAVIYLKMLLKSIRNDGMLTYTGVEDDFVGELALDIDEDEEDVRETLGHLVACKLVEYPDDTHAHLPYAVANTGSESDSAQRMRDYRDKNKVSQCDADVSQSDVEKEKDIRDRERDRERDRDRLSAQVRGALEEFCTMREKIGKPLTADDERKLIERLECMSDAESIKAGILRQSTRKRWADIYPLNKNDPAWISPEESSIDLKALEDELMRYRPQFSTIRTQEEGSKDDADSM